jgi:hypothetical protein
MKVNLESGTITMTLAEIGEIVGVRKKAAHMETIMADGKTENYLNVCYNHGVDMMAKYILDFFGNEFDKAQFAEWNK